MSTPRLIHPQARPVIEAVMREANVCWNDLTGRRRHPDFVAARRTCVRLMRERTGLSYPEIARSMGRTNHSSAWCSHARAMKLDPDGTDPLYILASALLPLHIGGESS